MAEHSSLTDRDLLVRIDERINSLEHRLLGNGQPGEIGNLRLDVDGLKADNNKAKGTVSGLQWVVGFIGSGALAQIGYTIWTLINPVKILK
jgi:hypothetical protein